MNPVSEEDTIQVLIERYLDETKESITTFSKKIGLDQAFLSRLKRGNPPPRTREGWRSAKFDNRYVILGKALGFESEEDQAVFLEKVTKEQSVKEQSEDFPSVSKSSPQSHGLFRIQCPGMDLTISSLPFKLIHNGYSISITKE